MSKFDRNQPFNRTPKAVSPEWLEDRSMLAGHGLAAAFEFAHHFGPVGHNPSAASSFATSASGFEFGRSAEFFGHRLHLANGRGALGATLADDSGLTAVVRYSTYTENGVTESRLKVSVSGAAPDSTLDVTVADTVVGTITTDATGTGSLVLSSNPDADEQQLPADLEIAAGTAVGVGTLSGTLAAATPSHPCGGADDGSTTTRLGARLSDPDNSAASAGVALKVKVDDTTGESTTTLRVHVSGAAASSTLDVTVGDLVIGQVTTDENGDAKVVFSSNPTGDQVAFSAVPTDVAADTPVTIGTLIGTFETAPHPRGFRHR